MAMASCASEATAPYYPEQLMGDALQAQAFPAASDEIGLWSGELDEQLVNGNGSLLIDDSRGSSGGPAAALCNTGAEHEQLTPPAAAASMALCLAYSGPTIRDIQKALSSRPCPSMARRHCGSLHLYGARSVTRGSRYTTATVMRSCGCKMPTDGYKWRKYGQKFIKTKPHPRSYYKCTSSTCNAKKHVDRATEDPEMFIVTYERLHHHGLQPLSLAPALKEYQGFRAAGGVHKPIMAKKKAWPSLMSSDDYNGADANTRGGNNRLQGRQKGVHRGSANSSMPCPADGFATSFSSDAQSAYWCCLDYRSFPEAHFQWTI